MLHTRHINLTAFARKKERSTYSNFERRRLLLSPYLNMENPFTFVKRNGLQCI